MTPSAVTYATSEADSLLVAGPALTVLLPRACAGHVPALWELVGGGARMDDLVEWLVDTGFRSFTSLLATEDLGEGAVRVLARGAAEVTSRDASGATQVHSGAERRTWLDVTLHDVVRLQSRAPATATGQWLPLRGGVVPASGFAVELASAPVAASPPEPRSAASAPTPVPVGRSATPMRQPDAAATPGPATVDPFHSLTLVPVLQVPEQDDAPAPSTDPGTSGGALGAASRIPDGGMHDDDSGDHDGHTITVDELARLRGAAVSSAAPVRDLAPRTVRAVVCQNRHPNPPNEAHCRICGASLEHGEITTVPRPILGSLVFDDGPVVPLEGSSVIGRSPRPPTGMRTDIPALVQVGSPEHGVSRSHLEVRVEGWSVTVLDLGSTNGTEVTLPGEAPRRLRRGEPCLVTPGTVVTLGEEVSATYEVAT